MSWGCARATRPTRSSRRPTSSSRRTENSASAAPVAVAIARGARRGWLAGAGARRALPALSAGGDVGGSRAQRSHRVVDLVADLGQALDDEPSGLGQRRAARASLAWAGRRERYAECGLRPSQVFPRVAIRPANLTSGCEQGAVLEDAEQELQTAVADHELTVVLEPHLRLDGNRRQRDHIRPGQSGTRVLRSTDRLHT